MLAVPDTAGLVDLAQVMHDGSKIQAQASPSSFRREKTVGERLEQARRAVEELGDDRIGADPQNQAHREGKSRSASERHGKHGNLSLSERL
ncbi:MAG: hypothetical protein HY822_07410 [Acidobacteria bacterium]|nr:hypothetical protein [Acidobacteriota bacterium]